MVEKALREEEQPEAPRKLTLAEKLATQEIPGEHIVGAHEQPTPGAKVPGRRGRWRR